MGATPPSPCVGLTPHTPLSCRQWKCNRYPFALFISIARIKDFCKRGTGIFRKLSHCTAHIMKIGNFTEVCYLTTA